ncbi:MULTISPECIES: type II toxin-antitoxin system HipA family toxin [Hyphomonas]|uniref:type II toxin-antitoxin system HipA family toxin n=1 Tax=Hyphomonas TaxID=85 RepID=UPI000B1A7832|nr:MULTISPECIES: type II toxin-antitoxin system HipA family toxin [Hyphomonas]
MAGYVAGGPLTEAEIAEIIHKLKVNPLGLDPDDNDFRISIAGAQDKTALLNMDEGGRPDCHNTYAEAAHWYSPERDRHDRWRCERIRMP